MGNGKVTNLESDVRAIVAEVLETKPEEINADSKFVEDLGMDSMMALEILAAIEKKFRIAIPENSLPKFTTLNETIKLVKQIIEKKR